MRALLLGVGVLACVQAGVVDEASAQAGQHEALIARHAAQNGLPPELVRRVMMKESGGRAHIVSAGNYGLMQIRHGTARGVGYTGSPQGLLDPETNMTYATKYLAGAYRAAGGNQALALSYYQRGYYYAAKRQTQTQVASAPGPLQIMPAAFNLASAPFTAALTPPTPREDRQARAREERRHQTQAVAAVQPVAAPVSDPSFPPPAAKPMSGAAPVLQPAWVQPATQTMPKGRQKTEPGLMDRLSAALAPDDKRRGKSGTWTKRILSQEAEAKRVEQVRDANKTVQ